MFPSQTWQDAQRRTATEKTEEDAAKAKEARSDMIYMLIAIFSILILISVIMVSHSSAPCYPHQKLSNPLNLSAFYSLELLGSWELVSTWPSRNSRREI
jgi:hypothetical protein